MASNLITIGRSGAMAARAALDITAQNIANASNPDYARRTLSMEEVAARGGIAMEPGASLSGVRPDQVLRTNSLFLQTEARRTSSDVGRANQELTGLGNAETAVEQAGIYPAIVDFEASLSRLSSDPLEGALRAAVIEDGRRLAQTFQIATAGLDVAEADLQFNADAGVERINLFAAELARTNVTLGRARPGSSNMAVLHDQRDALLRDMAEISGMTATFDARGRASVQIGGETLVQGDQSYTLAKTSNADGSFSFTVDGTGVTLASGNLLGASQAMVTIGELRTELDNLAGQLVSVANTAQAAGSAADGSVGQPFFSGTTASDIALALTGGDQIATAPAGAAAGSRDTSNLQALRDALANGGPAGSADAMLFKLSSAISARTITRDALQTIADTAGVALAAETGVDLDKEAADLLRYQQAFQASGRIIQVASDIFDTLLRLGR